MLTREELELLTKDELIEIILKLDARVTALEAQIREAHSAKAPFSKGTRKANPKRPGRRAGQGRFNRRPAPVPSASDVVEDLHAQLEDEQRNCPKCNSPLNIEKEIATVEDMPEVPVRIIKRVSVEVGVCPVCGHRVRGHHPSMGSKQWGAHAHQLGSRVLGHALALHYDTGLPLRKVPSVIAAMTGISLTQSALTQQAGKLCAEGGVLHAHYQSLREQVAQSAVVNTDDTGWRVNATLAFVMGFFTSDIAFYQIRSRHRHQEVLEVIGPEFGGKLGTDRGTSYEARELDEMAMQKCLSHLLKNLSAVEATKTGRAREFSAQLKGLLREGLVLWQEHQSQQMDLETYQQRGKVIEGKLDHHLRQRVLSDADNARLLKGIGKQHERGRVTLFLDEPDIEPTNNRAERGLRAAVIARKVSQCSKNERGATAYATLRSLFGTLRLRTQDVIGSFVSILKGAPLPNTGR